MDTTYFYKNLPIQDISITGLLSDMTRFSELPDDWCIIITDIKGSTGLYEEGRHRDSITVAARGMEVANRIAQRRNVVIPSVFGGDGATVIVPPVLYEEVLDALVLYHDYVDQTGDMNLRVGSVPLGYMREMGHTLRVARHTSLPYSSGALFLDSALSYADHIIKNNPDFQHSKPRGLISELSFDGMNQIWEPLHVPENKKSSLCLMINVLDTDNHATEYHRLLVKIDDIAGLPEERYSYLYGQRTKEGVPTDALNFDGMLKTVMVISDEKADDLIAFLGEEERAGRIIFGYHISKYPVLKISMTVQIDDPIGVIDVGEGGYVEASKVLKLKIQNLT